MTVELGLVFPAAHRRGGVELIALTVLERWAQQRTVAFVGGTWEGSPDVAVLPVNARGGPAALRPLRFRRAARQALSTDRPRTVLSFGANCPPGDVYWVHSVHRAWLSTGSTVRLGGVDVPGSVRRLLLRHQVLLHMERQYFTQHRPRAILCTSQREVDDLQHYYDVPAEIMNVVPNGYEGERFDARRRAEWREPARARMGVLADQVSLLFVVNELHRKGFAVLLNAVARLRDERVRVDVVGKASPAPFSGQIERLGLNGRVHWHGPTAEVERYMAAADLLVLPTQYEPFGLVIVEALAMGLPVITTALAGAAPAVVPGTGLLQQDPYDAEELADLLRQGLMPGVLDAWSAAAPAAAEPYEWGKVLARAEPLIFNGA